MRNYDGKLILGVVIRVGKNGHVSVKRVSIS